MTNFDQHNQRVDGDQHNAGRDINILSSDFLSEKSITAQLMVSLVIQAITYGLILLTLPLFYLIKEKSGLMSCVCCFAPFFGLQGLYSLFVGYQTNNKKIILLSIISGTTPIVILTIYFLITIAYAVFTMSTSP